MHFSLASLNNLVFRGGHYKMPVAEGHSTLLYNPNQPLDIYLELAPKAKFISLLISIDRFHSFFSEEASLIHFLDAEHKDQKYYFRLMLDDDFVRISLFLVSPSFLLLTLQQEHCS